MVKELDEGNGLKYICEECFEIYDSYDDAYVCEKFDKRGR